MLHEHLDSDSFRVVKKHAHQRAKQGMEICGAIIREEGGILSLRSLRNLATEPAKWTIEIEWLREIRRELKATGRKLVGTYHSHVGGYAYPGEKDLEYYPSSFLMMIYDIHDKRVGMWKPLIRKDKAELRAVAVTCSMPLWTKEDAVEYATYLKQKFRNKEKRNTA
jgi:proteasome lid subunit RPN8/RPN11